MKVTLADIQAARERIRAEVKLTEVDHSSSASRLIGEDVFFKYENQQYTGSFKIRGALNKIKSLTKNERAKGVVAASAGNHAQGVALSATKAGVQSTIVMPKAAPLVKVSATRGYGAEVILKGDIYDDAQAYARNLEQERGLTFVHPFEDPAVIAGQGTIGLEILEQLADVDTIVTAIGGGGLISGIATAVKAINPNCRIYGVQSEFASGMSSLFHKEPLAAGSKSKRATIADGIAVKNPSAVMYDSFISKLVDEVVTVSDEEIAEALVFLLERAKAVVEGSGGAPLAAVMNGKLKLGKKNCIILGGGNIDMNIISKVIEKGLCRNGRLVELSVVIDDHPGSLNRLTQVLAQQGANILQVNHDRLSQGLYLRQTQVDFALEMSGQDHLEAVKIALQEAGARIL